MQKNAEQNILLLQKSFWVRSRGLEMQKLLIAEDEAAIVSSLREYLKMEGFETVAADGQRRAEELLKEGGISLALLDVSLKDGSGYNVCKTAKDAGVPVIFLTASGDENSVVKGLDMGADDYIPKPFRPRELVSRIKSVLRRYSDSRSIVDLGTVKIDTDKGSVLKNGEPVLLSALEYKLLMVFVNNRGFLLSRNRLLEEIWDVGGDFVNDNTLTVYIKRLREKIEEDPQNPVIIKTVRGIGYRLD